MAALAGLCTPLIGQRYTTEPLLDPAGVLQVYPWIYFNADQLSRGRLPLWNHLTGLGQPHLANIQTAIFYPLYWAWYVVGGEDAYGMLMIFRLWLAAMLWFVFARTRTASFAGALVTGAAYGMGGYGLWFAQLIDLNSQLLLPALLLVWTSLWDRPRVISLVAAAALTALVIFGGHPEAAFITLFVGLAYTATMGAATCTADLQVCSSGNRRPGGLPYKSRWRGAAAVAASLALGGLLSLGVTIPFLNYLSRCWTMHGSGFGFIHLDPRGFFNLVVPGVHHFFKAMPTELPVSLTTMGMWEAFSAAYSATAAPGNLPGAGLVVCGLAAVALARPRRLNRHALFFVGLLAFTLGLTFGLPVFRLAAFVPPFNMNSNFKFFFSEIHAALAVLAGVGFERVFIWRPDTRHGKKLAAAMVGMLAVVSLIWVRLTYDPEGGSFAVIVINRVGFPAIGLAVALAAYRSRRWDWRPAGLAIIFITLFLALTDIRPFIRLRPGELDREQVSQAALKLLPPQQRMQGIDGFWPANRPLIDGVKDIRSSDALFYKPYVNLLNRINRLTPEQSLSYFYPSYYTQISLERLVSPEAAVLGIALAVGDELLLPDSIVERSIQNGRSVYGLSVPTRDNYLSLKARQPGLLLHAPARLEYTPEDHGIGTLSFSPHPGYGDGVSFAVTSSDSRPALHYSRFIRRPRYDRDAQLISSGEADLPLVRLTLPGQSFRLITLPGPTNERDSDQSAFIGLSYNPGAYRSPPRPDWNYQGKIFAYKLPCLPWSHLDGDTAALSVTRAAGDEVAIEVTAGPGRAGAVADRTLVVHEVWYPGWTAEIDGRPTTIAIPDDKVSWRLPLSPGARQVVFRFLPWDFRVGLGGAVTTALVCLLAVLFQRGGAKAQRRKNP